MSLGSDVRAPFLLFAIFVVFSSVWSLRARLFCSESSCHRRFGFDLLVRLSLPSLAYSFGVVAGKPVRSAYTRYLAGVRFRFECWMPDSNWFSVCSSIKFCTNLFVEFMCLVRKFCTPTVSKKIYFFLGIYFSWAAILWCMTWGKIFLIKCRSDRSWGEPLRFPLGTSKIYFTPILHASSIVYSFFCT